MLRLAHFYSGLKNAARNTVEPSRWVYKSRVSRKGTLQNAFRRVPISVWLEVRCFRSLNSIRFPNIQRFIWWQTCPCFHSSSAVAAQHSAACSHFAVKVCTSSGLSISVETAPDTSTIYARLSGLSKSGHGLKWFSLNGCPLRYCMNRGDWYASSNVLVFIFESE